MKLRFRKTVRKTVGQCLLQTFDELSKRLPFASKRLTCAINVSNNNGKVFLAIKNDALEHALEHLPIQRIRSWYRVRSIPNTCMMGYSVMGLRDRAKCLL